MEGYPTGTVVLHRKKPEFGYGIVVSSFPTSEKAMFKEDVDMENFIAVVLWHGDIDKEIVETPQVHTYSELKIINTTVGFA